MLKNENLAIANEASAAQQNTPPPPTIVLDDKKGGGGGVKKSGKCPPLFFKVNKTGHVTRSKSRQVGKLNHIIRNLC